MKGCYNVSVDSVQIDGVKWQIVVSLDPAKYRYLKDTTEAWEKLVWQDRDQDIQAFNHLPIAERRQIAKTLEQLRSAQEAWIKALGKGVRDRHIEKRYVQARESVPARYWSLCIAPKTFLGH